MNPEKRRGFCDPPNQRKVNRLQLDLGWRDRSLKVSTFNYLTGSTAQVCTFVIQLWLYPLFRFIFAVTKPHFGFLLVLNLFKATFGTLTDGALSHEVRLQNGVVKAELRLFYNVVARWLLSLSNMNSFISGQSEVVVYHVSSRCKLFIVYSLCLTLNYFELKEFEGFLNWSSFVALCMNPFLSLSGQM